MNKVIIKTDESQEYIKPIKCEISKKKITLFKRMIDEIRKEELAFMELNPYFLGVDRKELIK